MNALNSTKNNEFELEKCLGRKIKRFKNSLKSNFKSSNNPPPSISKTTLNQIEKIHNNSNYKFENLVQNISTNKNYQKFTLPELSLKEQYQDLLNRKELILPPKYRLLLKKQNYLDDILSENSDMNINSNNKDINYIHSYIDIQNKFNKKMNMNFNNNDFQQILFVCPFYYIYQSIDKISKGVEIKYIDIPNDYAQRMTKKYNLRTNFTLMQTPKNYEPIKGEINKAVLEKRKKLFKKILINITLEQHQKFLKENNFNIFDPIKSKTWHHNFDLKNVKDIGVYNLVENNIKEYKKLLII